MELGNTIIETKKQLKKHSDLTLNVPHFTIGFRQNINKSHVLTIISFPVGVTPA